MLLPGLLDSARNSLQASAEGWQVLAEEASRRLRLSEVTDRVVLPERGRFGRRAWKRIGLGLGALALLAVVGGALVWALTPGKIEPVVSPLPPQGVVTPPAPPAPVPVRKPARVLKKLRAPAPVVRAAPKVDRGQKVLRKPKPQPSRRKLNRF
jgi:hypothetical protein